MTRIIALSDTHLEHENIPAVVAALARGADIILHAGDFVSAQAYAALADLGRLEAVHGNSDCFELKRLLPERKVIEVDGIRIGLVHMASHGSDLVGAQMMAREMDVHVLVFGHTHRPLIERGKRLLICPGSTTLPRMSAPSVAELEIIDGNVRGNIIPVGSPACNYLKYAGELARDAQGSKK
ncbi:MAG: metallophosphoesterase [Methanotrichaceae archaeon]|nr:metallophosphoesterase [Methanotrichaceae archaeon]